MKEYNSLLECDLIVCGRSRPIICYLGWKLGALPLPLADGKVVAYHLQ